MNVQVIARPDGTPLWFSRALPGRTHDLTAARAHGIVQACLTRHILVLADRAYQGAGATVRTPYYHHKNQTRPLPAVQPRPRPPASTRRTRLRPAEVLEATSARALFHQPHRPRHPSHPHPADLQLFRMKEVQRGKWARSTLLARSSRRMLLRNTHNPQAVDGSRDGSHVLALGFVRSVPVWGDSSVWVDVDGRWKNCSQPFTSLHCGFGLDAGRVAVSPSR
ncbi:transposase family protein [Streptomyces vinaceus]|uniref:transposase family protein n=1 Tax=Streptomyces vinaceus TaxID=1960 RepID=UPI0036A5DAA7